MSNLTFMGVPVWPNIRGFNNASMAEDYVADRRSAGVKVRRIYFHPALIQSMVTYAHMWEGKR